MSTKIEWTDETWNPIRGCSRVSEGCRNCYAEKVAYRFSGPGQPYEGLVREVYHQIEQPKKRLPQWNGNIKFVEEHLMDPLRWKKPRRIFVNSMSDLFHENVQRWIHVKIFAVMALARNHTFQILTKRPQVMLALLLDPRFEVEVAEMVLHLSCIVGTFDKPRHHPAFRMGPSTGNTVMDMPRPIGFEVWPLPNVHLGVSVEDQKTADERIPLLLQTPAAVRFVSAEPLLGAIDLTALNGMTWFLRWMALTNPHAAMRNINNPNYPQNVPLDALRGHCMAIAPDDQAKLDWLIVGGESGPGARPMHPDWARRLRDQCAAAGVPFFFKQWGEWLPWEFDGGYSELKSQSGKLMDRHALPDMKDASVRDWTDDCLHDGADVCIHQRIGKKAAGHLLNGKEYHQFPEVKR